MISQQINLVKGEEVLRYTPLVNLRAIQELLQFKGYKLLCQGISGKVVYLSVVDGKFWIRSGNASDVEPTVRTDHRTNRITLSVPKKWLQLDKAKPSTKTKVLKLQASGFEPTFHTVGTTAKELQYQLNLGNTCLILHDFDLTTVRGIYVHFKVDCFEIKTGGSSELTPHVYHNNGSLWVPKDFITNEETTMDLVSVVMAAELYAVEVEFAKGGARYTYKSASAHNVGDKVVVDSPANGLVVVTVTGCSKGLDTNTDKFPAYKWVVSAIDLSEYNRLRDMERNMLEKAKAKKRLEQARAQLEELGVTPEELIAMVKGE